MSSRQQFLGNFATYVDSDNFVGKANSPWQSSPILPALCDPASHVLYRDDFLAPDVASNAIPGWTATVATSGSIVADATNPNGLLTISAGAATAGQGVNAQMSASPWKVSAGKPVWFEAGLKFTGLTSLNIQFFLGLAAQSTAIIASGAVAAIDRIGFQGVVTNGVIQTACRGGGTAVTGAGLTLVNNTTYRLGFIARSTGVTFLVNGQAVNTIATQIPTGGLAPALVCQANGTSTPGISLDWMQVLGYRQ